MAVFVTGDTHGDFTRLRPLFFPEQSELTKEDYVIICGDFGGVWDNSPEDAYWLDWLEEKPFTTLFLDGNHENFDLLAGYPTEQWHGGQVQPIRPSVLHLTRGQIYTIQGKTFFTMGGAASHDISGGVLNPNDPLFQQKRERLAQKGEMYRILHRTWWQEELPSPEEYQTALKHLDRHNWSVDYILTHCCPASLQPLLGAGLCQVDELTCFLDEIFQRCQFKAWFFGHYHRDQNFGKQFFLLHEKIFHLLP